MGGETKKNGMAKDRFWNYKRQEVVQIYGRPYSDNMALKRRND